MTHVLFEFYYWVIGVNNFQKGDINVLSTFFLAITVLIGF